MTTDDINTQQETSFREAPASWNTRFINRGYVCQLTIRAESGEILLQKAESAISYLIKNGYEPIDTYQRHNGNKGNGSNGQGKQCPIHHCQMKRFEKDDKSWYSHKTDSGWCYGKQAKKGT